VDGVFVNIFGNVVLKLEEPTIYLEEATLLHLKIIYL